MEINVMMLPLLQVEIEKKEQESRKVIKGNNALKKRVLDLICIYTFATALVLIPGCIDPNSYMGSIAFFFAIIIVIFFTKDLVCLSFYFISLLINSSLSELPVIGTSYTLTSVIYGYFILLTIICLTKRNRIKQMEMPFIFLMLWVSYLVLLGIYFKQGIAYSLWNCVPLYICFVCQILVLRKAKYQLHLISCLIASLLIMCFTGYFELILGRTFFYSLWKGVAYRFGIVRIGSTVADPNFLCLVELALFFLLRSNVFEYCIDCKLAKIMQILIAFQIVLTFSRTGIIAIFFGYAIEVLCSKKKMMLLIIPFIFIGLLALPLLLDVIFNLDVNSTVSRFQVIEAALSMWRISPIIGNGSGAFYNNSYSLIGTQLLTMNEYIEQLVSYGIVGLGFYIAYFFFLLKKPFLIILSENTLKKRYILHFSASLSTWIIMSASLDTFSKVLFWIFPSVATIIFHSIKSDSFV